MPDPDYKALCAELLDCDDGAIFGTDLVTRARAALEAQPEPVADGEVVELVVELREKFEQLIKCSRAYDGYSTMTPVELADRLIDVVLKLEAGND